MFQILKNSRAGLLAAASVLALLSASVSAQAKGRETVLYSFTGGADGAQATAGLLRDQAGNLYGTALGGGSSGYGVLFEVSPQGQETILHAFTGGADGALPVDVPIMDAAGNLYGTTDSGGASNAGVIFELTAQGKFKVLYSFTGGNDGAEPRGFVMDRKGNLYGTTIAGGANGAGVVFKLTPKGKLSVLYTFTGGNDGAEPRGLVSDGKGNLYGTTLAGGAYNVGVIFEVTPKGTETVFHTFGFDGALPNAALIRDDAGNLYGATNAGGDNNAGIVFKFAPDGTETVLYTFTGGDDGGNPHGSVAMDKSGNLYGPAISGGARGAGVIFKVSPGGQETVLYTFTGGNDGAEPSGHLVLDNKNNLYGGTTSGGSSGAGVVFRFGK